MSFTSTGYGVDYMAPQEVAPAKPTSEAVAFLEGWERSAADGKDIAPELQALLDEYGITADEWRTHSKARSDAARMGQKPPQNIFARKLAK